MRAQLASLAVDPYVSSAGVAEARAALDGGDLQRAVRLLQGLHAMAAVEGAVAEGRMTRNAADEVLQRLRAGEDPHVLRRQLQQRGIALTRRHTQSDDAG